MWGCSNTWYVCGRMHPPSILQALDGMATASVTCIALDHMHPIMTQRVFKQLEVRVLQANIDQTQRKSPSETVSPESPGLAHAPAPEHSPANLSLAFRILVSSVDVDVGKQLPSPLARTILKFQNLMETTPTVVLTQVLIARAARRHKQ